MPFINTNDNYVKEYCKTHPEAELYLNELIELKNKPDRTAPVKGQLFG